MELQNAIQQLMNDCGRISNNVASARDTSYESQQDITSAERSIDEAERLLREAESLLETEGAEALRKAREAQDRAGQQSERMTEIAKEARELAERYVHHCIRTKQTNKKETDFRRRNKSNQRQVPAVLATPISLFVLKIQNHR